MTITRRLLLTAAAALLALTTPACLLSGGKCESNRDCALSNYCEFPYNTCGEEGAGVCDRKPDFCPDLWEPVCGCDGETYPNSCEAAQDGVAVDAEGECED